MDMVLTTSDIDILRSVDTTVDLALANLNEGLEVLKDLRDREVSGEMAIVIGRAKSALHDVHGAVFSQLGGPLQRMTTDEAIQYLVEWRERNDEFRGNDFFDLIGDVVQWMRVQQAEGRGIR